MVRRLKGGNFIFTNRLRFFIYIHEPIDPIIRLKFQLAVTERCLILYRVTNGSSIARKHFRWRRMDGVMEYRERRCALRSAR